ASYNAAVLAELNRDFKKAIDLYTKYDREETDRRKKDRVLWSEARIYRSSGDVYALTDTYDKWRRIYGNDPGNEDDLVFSSYDLAKAWQKKGRTKQADDAGKAAIAAWRKKGATKNTQGAKWAGEWALTFVERDREKTWVPYGWKVGARN